MISERSVLRVVESIYAAAENAQLWNNVLTQLNDLFRTTHSALFLQNSRNRTATMAAYIWSPDSIARYSEHYARVNPWLYAPGAGVHLGSSHTSEMLVSERDLMRTEFYSDFLAPDNIHHMIGACVYEEQDIQGNITLLRPKSAQSFDDAEISALRLLMPHLTRALQLHHRCFLAQSVNGVLQDIVNRFSTAVFLLDSQGQLISANTAGERLLASNAALRLEKRTLILSTPAQTTALRRLIADATKDRDSITSRGGGAMRCERPSGDPPLELLVCRAPVTEGILDTQTPAVVLFVNDTAQPSTADSSIWQRLYGFTNAECVVAQHMLRGERVPVIAAAIGISVNTVRTHLKSLFGKTDTHRQSEFVRLLSGGIGSVRH